MHILYVCMGVEFGYGCACLGIFEWLRLFDCLIWFSVTFIFFYFFSVSIGPGSIIEYTIVGKGVKIGKQSVLSNVVIPVSLFSLKILNKQS